MTDWNDEHLVHLACTGEPCPSIGRCVIRCKRRRSRESATYLSIGDDPAAPNGSGFVFASSIDFAGRGVDPASDEGARSTPQRVKLMSEYCVALPLWSDEGGLSEGVVPLDLEDQLRACADVFDEHFDHESGWPNIAMCRAQYQEGLRLFGLLRQQLEPTTRVTFDFWENHVQGKRVPMRKIRSA